MAQPDDWADGEQEKTRKYALKIWGVRGSLLFLIHMDINCNLFFVRKMCLKTAWLLDFWTKKIAPSSIVLYTFKWEKQHQKETGKEHLLCFS